MSFRDIEAGCVRQDYLHLITSTPSLQSVNRRQASIEALHRNVRNPVVRRVHLLGEQPAEYAEAVAGLPPPLRAKTVFVPLDRPVLYADAFGYAASEALNNSLCLVMPSDVVVSTGFQALVPWRVGSIERLRPYLFALSAHPSDECLDQRNECWQYGGNHAAFLFVPPLRPAAVRRLAFRPADPNAAAAVMLLLKDERQLWNPCKLLVVHHLHCLAPAETEEPPGYQQQQPPPSRQHSTQMQVKVLVWPTDHLPRPKLPSRG
eukprot:EG_transcript_11914